jgi:hypothetical protein
MRGIPKGTEYAQWLLTLNPSKDITNSVAATFETIFSDSITLSKDCFANIKVC